jgi:3-deoxy-7-phosphoheptulonate synthase
MGAEKVEGALRPMLAAVRDTGHPVVWACDPMHGNTFTSGTGHKTRHFDAILAEIRGFFAAHDQVGTVPGGVHVELTSDDVTECLGGGEQLGEGELDLRYETICDPRLNGRQSLDLAFEVAGLLRR